MTSVLHRPVILASTSTYRRELLARLRIPFDVVAPQVDETPLATETPRDLACRLAMAKAQAVALQYPGAVVIGSDQVADLEVALIEVAQVVLLLAAADCLEEVRPGLQKPH